MITIDDVKEQYIMPLLESTGLQYNIVTDVGEFEKNMRKRNTVTNVINGLLQLTESEVQKIGNLSAIAYTANLSFLIPIEDTAENNEYPNVISFRSALSAAFSTSNSISITDANGTAYVGGVSYSLPSVGQRAQRDLVGDSVIYSCSVSVAFLPNALNSTNIKMYVNGEQIQFMAMNPSRMPSLSADLLSKSKNSEATTYAESTSFKLEFSMPALQDSSFSIVVLRWILGLSDANIQFMLTMKEVDGAGNEKSLITDKPMIIGGASASVSGVTNVTYNVSLVPYTSAESIGG